MQALPGMDFVAKSLMGELTATKHCLDAFELSDVLVSAPWSYAAACWL